MEEDFQKANPRTIHYSINILPSWNTECMAKFRFWRIDSGRSLSVLYVGENRGSFVRTGSSSKIRKLSCDILPICTDKIFFEETKRADGYFQTPPPPIAFELMMVSKSWQHLLGKVYHISITCKQVPSSTTIQWEKDMQSKISTHEWLRTNQFNATFSLNVNIRESRYKILQRWYLTPARMYKIFTDYEDKCWRCGTKGGTYIGMWWLCPSIKKFCFLVYKEVKLT